MELFKGVPFIIIIIIRRSLLVLLVNRAFVTESLSLFKRRSLFATPTNKNGTRRGLGNSQLDQVRI